MIYLDNGATSFPKPRGMIEAMEKCMTTYCGNPGRSGHDMSFKTGQKIYECRSLIGELFNISECDRIIFTLNTTAALNMGIKGVLRRGDHFVTTSMEHNSVLRPLKAIECAGISGTIVKADSKGQVKAEEIMAAVTDNTRLIICTHASNVTGTIMPIKKLGAFISSLNMRRQNEGKRRIVFMVDGAQSGGVLDIDVEKMKIDLLAMPGHKGLLGPLGTGFLYAGKNAELRSIVQGGTGTASRELRQPEEFPEGFESGTVNAPGIIGLGHSIGWLKKRGTEAIRCHEGEMIGLLDSALANMDGIVCYGPESSMKTGITLINLKGTDCEEAASVLNDSYGIAVRSGFHCAGLAHRCIGTWDTGAIRISVGPFTTKRDIRCLVDGLWHMTRF